MYNNKHAFTLAEVLITLGIIGIVAAMTIPTLISGITGQRYRSQLKKTISTLNQAVRLNKAKYDWDFADVDTPCSNEDFLTHTSDNKMSVCSILNSNLSSKHGVTREYVLKNNYNYQFKGNVIGISRGTHEYTVYSLPDGSLVGVRSGVFNTGCTIPTGKTLSSEIGNMHRCTGFIDVNGISLPNEEVKCSTGATSKTGNPPCTVKTKDIKDVYPVVFHDSIVEPMTNAARYVFQTAK